MKSKSSPSKELASAKLGELERLGPGGRDVLVMAVEAPGFDTLPTECKIFAYFLYRAAIAGDQILYKQNHRHALEIKKLLESIFEHSAGMPDDLRESVHDYLKYIWIHHGNYHHATHTKFVPNYLTPEVLRAAIELAVEAGAMIPLSPDETLDDMLSRLEPTIFEAEHEPHQSYHAAKGDIVAASAVNFWDPGVTHKDIDGLPDEWKNKINVRFAKRDGQVIPEVYKIGGVFDEELRTVSHFLLLALPHAETEEQRESIQCLLDFYQTGDEERFRDHSVHWLRSDTNIDYINGFIENYIDPRGIIGNFEANVSFAASEPLIDRLADNALYFERKMPWPEKYKRQTVDRPVAKVVNVLVETGDAGPVSPAAYNLPNYNDIRRDHGSKNVILWNIENIRSMELLQEIAREFYLPEYRDNVIKYYYSKVRPFEVYMHEIIGHGSGQPEPTLAVDPRTALGRSYSAIEECRADLVALYHMSDPKLVEIGAFREDEHQAIVETAYVTYTQGWLTRYDRVIDLEVREAHNKGNQTILMYLVENGGDNGKDFGLDVVEQDGDYFVKLRDAGKVRIGLAELLEKVQVLKSTGDGPGAAALLDRFGTRVKAEWYRNMVDRVERTNLPKIRAFTFPHLTPVMDGNRITDVRMAYDEDLTSQALRFSRLQQVTDLSAD